MLTALIGPLIIYKFTVNASLALLDEFPEDNVSAMFLGEGNGTLFSALASWMEARIDAAAIGRGRLRRNCRRSARGAGCFDLGAEWFALACGHVGDCCDRLARSRPACGDLHGRRDGLHSAFWGIGQWRWRLLRLLGLP